MSERLSLLADHIDPNSPYSKFDKTPAEKRGWVSQTGTHDIERERRNATFDPRRMNYFLHSGETNAKFRERIMAQFEHDPTFRMDDVHDLTRPQIRERIMTRLGSLVHHLSSENVSDTLTRLSVLTLVDAGFTTRCNVHFGLFVPTILNQGTEEQKNHWIKKGMLNFRQFIGCYSMTEMGHGSNVAGLETTATFDKEKDEFVIHSPTLTSVKFWIGGAAESATHTVVFANLVVDGKNYGVKPFVVQLRDIETYNLRPGINIGDIGAKMGRNGIDNGWIRFTYVRVPRTNMLMKFTKVSKNGRVTEPPMSQIAYSALLLGRTAVMRESAEMAKKALVIAIRYAVVRKQFSSVKNGPENQIMDYKTHQFKLIPLLAYTYAMELLARKVRVEYDKLLEKINVKNLSNDQMASLVETMKELHSSSASGKAIVSWKTLETIEQCRQSCGGMGYLAYANLSALYQDHVVHCTWEGDNTVLTLQTGRYLVSAVREAAHGKKLPEGVGHLNKLPGILKQTYRSSNVADLEVIQEALDVTCANLAARAAKLVEENLSKGMELPQALEKASSAVFMAAKLHSENQLFCGLKQGVQEAEQELKPIVKSLASILGLSIIQQYAGSFLQFGYFSPKHMGDVESKFLALLDEVRPQVIPLTDAFGLSDFVINSPLGCYDGDVYHRIMNRVLQSNPQGPHTYFERTLKPFLFRKNDKTEVIQLRED